MRKIAVDGGALCTSRKGALGTFAFSIGLIEALSQYDHDNDYDVYTFCAVKSDDRNVRMRRVWPRFGFLKVGISLREAVNNHDIFLALNQAIPLYTKSKIISFCHGLSYLHYPDCYRDSYSHLHSQLEYMMHRSDVVVTSTIGVTRDLERFFPGTRARLVTLPFGIPQIFATTQKKARKPYFLYVGSSQPIKRVDLLIKMYRHFQESRAGHGYRMVLVGNHESVFPTNGVEVIPYASGPALKRLYQEAAAYLTVSRYESFNFPALEALSQNCPVIAMKGSLPEEIKHFAVVASANDEFVSLLQKAARGEMDYNSSKQVNKTFSTKAYVTSLMKLYENIGNSVK